MHTTPSQIYRAERTTRQRTESVVVSHVRRNEGMPSRMATLAQIGCWPALSLDTKKRTGRPVMSLSPGTPANFAYSGQLPRVPRVYVQPGALNSPTLCKLRSSVTTRGAYEWVFRLATGINVEPYFPRCLCALRAGPPRIINFVFPRGARHEALPLLQ